MNYFELTLSQRSSGGCSYPEDDWDMEYTINSEEELLEALKEAYLRDARNRNNYPIVSFPFFIDFDELDDEQSIIFKLGVIKFKKWKNKIKTLLPILRKAKKEKDKESFERKKLSELADKYEYLLVKIVKRKEYLLASYFDEEYMIITEEEQRLLKNASEDIFINIENDSFYSCSTPSSWKLTPKGIDIRSIQQGIKEFMDDEKMFENNGNLKKLIKKCKENKNGKI